ncbi:DNA cytosine methyltransferase [Campylobacter devanensis]|uniref:DNA cytosine methyltransferase n=1 Tax=Campylobacter devanensis TaxID=3161138 RepID=UPI000A348EDA|nr:DNA cytosine methyltransferase [Campylobacter sp. P0087]
MSFNICEFFVGAGGSHLGFMQNEFETVYVNDFDENALKTLTYNNKELLKNSIIDNTDITKIEPKKLKDKINKSIDVCFGGIVCKGFSLAGERSPNDARNHFYKYYLDIVAMLRPKISIIENVKGMLTAKILPKNCPENILNQVDILWQELENYKGKKAKLRKDDNITTEFENYGKELKKKKANLLKEISKYQIGVIDEIVKIYNELGYKVEYKILNSAWYGSATKRERLIIVAVRDDLKGKFNFPLPIFSNGEINTKMDFETDLLNKIEFKQPNLIGDVLAKIDYSDLNDEDNKPMQHSLKTVERFRYIKPGSNIAECVDDLPKHLQISKFYSRGNTMRLSFDSLAPTLVPGHSNFPLHPKYDRSITVREAATITGFPIDYKFFGSHSKRCEQVGNAVPPPLANAIAKEVKKLLIDNL